MQKWWADDTGKTELGIGGSEVNALGYWSKGRLSKPLPGNILKSSVLSDSMTKWEGDTEHLWVWNFVALCNMQPFTSTMSEFVRLSWGSLYSVYLSNTLSMSVLAYWKSLLELLKIMSAISQSHNTLSSYAFFIRPNFLLVKVTYSKAQQKKVLLGIIQGVPQDISLR